MPDTHTDHHDTFPSIDPPENLTSTDDFVTLSHVPQSRPSRYVVQVRRYGRDGYLITQSSEPMGKREAAMLAVKWAKWHRLDVR